ncbi:unnamed protein product [Paramecium sonneborni]|uniref:Transmembrane protein n=1 Tax=Paramecium sonneborni TaxID=65129 RepID=A0A8S1LKJ3_9CILI|nr:unnamed protein product [Paramecium sonneborni]
MTFKIKIQKLTKQTLIINALYCFKQLIIKINLTLMTVEKLLVEIFLQLQIIQIMLIIQNNKNFRKNLHLRKNKEILLSKEQIQKIHFDNIVHVQSKFYKYFHSQFLLSLKTNNFYSNSQNLFHIKLIMNKKKFSQQILKILIIIQLLILLIVNLKVL